MDQCRDISKVIEHHLHDYYSQGVLTPHIFPIRSNTDRYNELFPLFLKDDDEEYIEDEDIRRYWSTPDSEAIIANTNFIQSDHGLNDFMRQFKNYVYLNDSKEGVYIHGAKIGYPHVSHVTAHHIPAPHPSMSDEELQKYVWPSSKLNRENTSYVATLWLDVGAVDEEFNEEDEDGAFISVVNRTSLWKRVMDIPIQVGSNRCNLAIMRSYLEDETYDEKYDMTWGERARRFLEDYVRWEPLLPDGYFVISGKMKRINISDKLIMNMSYVIKQSSIAEYGTKKLIPIRERLVEVRSVRPELGLSYLRIILIAPPKDELKAGKGMNNDIFKFYNSTLHVMIDKEFPEPINLFDLVRGYGVIVLGMEDTKKPMLDLFNMIKELSHGDMESIRIATISMANAGSEDTQSVINQYRYLMLPQQNRGIDEANDALDDLSYKMRRKVLPHCEIGDLTNPSKEDLEASYTSKIRYLAMMCIDLILCTTYKQGTTEFRKEVTDRKDFSYKRWEAVGHRFRDHIRSMLVPTTQWRGKGEDREMIYGTTSLPKMEKSAKQLIDFMNRNQWPSKYRQGGTFKAKKDEHKDGLVDDIPKYNIISVLDSLRTVKISAKGGPNTSGIRRVHTSQWGQQCPSNTPENANIGLNNNMAEMCLITNDLTYDEKEALRETIDDLPSGKYLLMIDGNPLKYVSDEAYSILIQARRRGDINRGIGIAMHYLWSRELNPGIPVIIVRTSHGRPIFPVLILDQSIRRYDDIMSLTDTELENRVLDGDYKNIIDYLLSGEIIEFIDAYELVYNAVVAPWLDTVRQEYEDTDMIRYTHAMIKPGHILSQASNCLSFVEHNPAARGTYATQHIKQAIGRPFLHPEDRYDHETNYLFNPEPPLLMTDTMRRILYPPELYRPEGGIKPRDIGIGRNVNIISMSFDGNNDDGLVISETLFKSGVFDGEHYSVTTADKGILPTSMSTYDWMIDVETRRDIRDDRDQGIPDPYFSASVVIPYGDPYVIDIPEDDMMDKEYIDIDNVRYYELIPGEMYTEYGFYSAYIITYRRNTTGDVFEDIVMPGKNPISLPDTTILSKEKGQRVWRLALSYISPERYEIYKNGSINREHRSSTVDTTENIGIVDTRYLVSVSWNNSTWYAMKSNMPIPKTQLPGMTKYTRVGNPVGIRPRRAITRGDIAVKIVRRRDTTINSEVIDPKGEKDRFEITHGYVDGIIHGTPIKLRSAMPIEPKPGNKYAALYAQKSVIARIVPDEDMPKARWYNEILGKWEEMIFDVVFNPLSFPSRMTIGMEYEIFIAGTLRYLYSVTNNLYHTDRDAFDTMMEDTYDISDASYLVDYLSDSTCFIYDNQEKYRKCKDLRYKIGIPDNALYDVYLKDSNGVDNEDVLRDLPSHRGWNRKISEPILCGTVFYVALRHLVDNKRRARGYVGRKDPLTLQPVKGRRKNGGSNTGTMETDAYKAHGAGGMLLERLSKVSDHKVFNKCTRCGGLVSKLAVSNILQCVDCQKQLAPNEVIEHDTVNSWRLFQVYCRSIGIEIKEHFE